MKSIRKLAIFFAVFILCSTVNIFAKDVDYDYLIGTWKYHGKGNQTITLIFKDDYTYIYGCNDSSQPKSLNSGDDTTYDNDFNIWWFSGEYEVDGNHIKTVPLKTSGNKESGKGLSVTWVATIGSYWQLYVNGGKWKRTYQRERQR